MKYRNVEDYVINAGNNRNSAVLNALLNSEPGMKELPDNPDEDGEYSLINSVVDGESELYWGEGGGGASNVLVVHVEYPGGMGSQPQLNKTWQEIFDADSVVIIDKYEAQDESEVSYSRNLTVAEIAEVFVDGGSMKVCRVNCYDLTNNEHFIFESRYPEDNPQLTKSALSCVFCSYNSSTDTYTLGQTWSVIQEEASINQNNYPYIEVYDEEETLINRFLLGPAVKKIGEDYKVYAFGTLKEDDMYQTIIFETQSPEGYPSYQASSPT